MLGTLILSFARCGHEVFYPTAGHVFNEGRPVRSEGFVDALIELSNKCDAGLVIAPDEILGDLTEIIEKNTINLGCSSRSVRLCADKLECTRTLFRDGIPVPETIGSGEYTGDFVIKPRYGCASEGIHKSGGGILKNGFIATRLIKGEHISVSMVVGKTQLPLTINRQFIEIDDKFSYKGGSVPYHCERDDEIIETAKKTGHVLGCSGYIGVDIVLGKKPYVVDVNPRPTTSIIGISKVLETEIADLIMESKFGGLPPKVGIKGSFSFRKKDLFFF
ncbi:MAG: ATP-grasp domain-containing protein [Candidatus Methanoperedens sp.]|nr:ATP-grasp domain-containing protein [Candidatus Methanoperedens sp.]MCE8425512.1 ATP-grasp domain-containing protein [Candidatus Methanoperedens sp.]MCE8429025.1 ATP-grasp domain-containing protein [Candidatus Methanoperedens sp.]